MQNFDDIKNLWQKSGGSNDLPSAKEIIAKIEATRKKIIRKNILAIIILCFTFIFITWIGFHYDFEKITTRIGIVIILIGIVFAVFFNTRLVNLLARQNDPTLNNDAYLQQLIKFRSRQQFMQTKGISVYFILLTIGIILYMYEFASRDLTFGIIIYTVTLGWIAFNWFIIRKKTISKQEKEINEQIESIEKLMNNMRS